MAYKSYRFDSEEEAITWAATAVATLVESTKWHDPVCSCTSCHLLSLVPKYIIGIDLSKEGSDKTVQQIRGLDGEYQ